MKNTDLSLQLVITASVLVLTLAASIRQKRDAGPSVEQPQGGYGRSYFIAYACERRQLILSCGESQETEGTAVKPTPGPRQKISIVHAMYGRQFPHYCPTEELQSLVGQGFPLCAAPRSQTTSFLSRKCNGKEVCHIPVVNELFGDPCPNTYKYLEVYYACSEVREQS